MMKSCEACLFPHVTYVVNLFVEQDSYEGSIMKFNVKNKKNKSQTCRAALKRLKVAFCL